MWALFLFATQCLAAVSNSKPLMGWNSYNAFGSNINQTVIQATADALVSTGMLEAGYQYLNLDDGWADVRDADGNYQANATRFPSGMASIADYAHERGLKLGIYSDAGILGCTFKPGSYGYEERDAATYASWGVDLLKYDNCGGFQGMTLSVQERYWRMASALQMSGRDIFFSLCEWGFQFPWLWADQFSDSYRVAGDIHASFATDGSGVCKTAYCLNTGYAGTSVLTLIRKMREISYFQKPGSWGDMDLLEIGNGAMNELEEQTHFSFWAALKSPLIASTNLATVNSSSLQILLNKDMIALSQDDAGVAVSYVPSLSTEGSTQIWAGPLSSGNSKFVILALNQASTAQNISFSLCQVPGFATAIQGKAYSVKDVWGNQSLTPTKPGNITLGGVQTHQTKVLVFSQ